MWFFSRQPRYSLPEFAFHTGRLSIVPGPKKRFIVTVEGYSGDFHIEEVLDFATGRLEVIESWSELTIFLVEGPSEPSSHAGQVLGHMKEGDMAMWVLDEPGEDAPGIVLDLTSGETAALRQWGHQHLMGAST